MKHTKSFLKTTKAKVILILALLAAGVLLRGRLERLYIDLQADSAEVNQYTDGSRVGRTLNYAENVPEENALLQAFYKKYPTASMIAACEEDLTDDGYSDLVVIYNTPEKDENSDKTELIDGGYIRLLVVMGSGSGEDFKFTEPIPAPVENQKIQFQNIDKKDENEFVLHGQKGAKVGYGIYRVMGNKVVNLFGEGMEDC